MEKMGTKIRKNHFRSYLASVSLDPYVLESIILHEI